MKTKTLLVLIVVFISCISIVFCAEFVRFSGMKSTLVINSVDILPYAPQYGTNITFRSNVTEPQGNSIIYVKNYLISPSNYYAINGTNATIRYQTDYWNSTSYIINESGQWNYLVVSDTNLSSPIEYYSSFTITDNVYSSPASIQLSINLSSQKLYNISLWTDTSELENYTLNITTGANITFILNTTYIMVNSSPYATFNLNITSNTTSIYGNHTFNLTAERFTPSYKRLIIPINVTITDNYGDVEFKNPIDYTFTACPGALIHSVEVQNLGNYPLTNCDPQLYDAGGNIVSTSTNFNLAAGANGSASVTYVMGSSTATTHMRVICSSSNPSGTPDSTSSEPQIMFNPASSGCGSGGGGGGGGSQPVIIQPSVEIKQYPLTNATGTCGDGICSTTEKLNPLNCLKDCGSEVWELNKIFCTPLFKCGNWEKAWFTNGAIIFILGSIGLYLFYSGKPKRQI